MAIGKIPGAKPNITTNVGKKQNTEVVQKRQAEAPKTDAPAADVAKTPEKARDDYAVLAGQQNLVGSNFIAAQQNNAPAIGAQTRPTSNPQLARLANITPQAQTSTNNFNARRSAFVDELRSSPRPNPANGHPAARRNSASMERGLHNGAALARSSLDALDAPPGNHPAMRYQKMLTTELERRGLPTNARGVHVHVVDVNRKHGAEVTRSVGGPVGLGKGATIFEAPIESGLDNPYMNFHPSEVELFTAIEDRVRALPNATSIDAYLSFAAMHEEMSVHTRRNMLARTVANIPDGYTQPTIVNFSWGTHQYDAAKKTIEVWRLAGNDTVLNDLTSQFTEARGRPPANDDELTFFLTSKALDVIRTHPRAKEARRRLETDLKKARNNNVLVLEAAGNEDFSSNKFSYGSVLVAASKLNHPTNLNDDGVTDFSGIGHLAAPGEQLPVGSGNGRIPTDTSGTSFASPFLAGVAALMVKANPNITATQIHAIFRSGFVTRDIAGDQRDGAGTIDPVLAVQMAADLAE